MEIDLVLSDQHINDRVSGSIWKLTHAQVGPSALVLLPINDLVVSSHSTRTSQGLEG